MLYLDNFNKYQFLQASEARIYYIRFMALAALYKWITSTDQVDQVELDKMIQKYPFAQNLQIVKALSHVDSVHDLKGQLYSLEPSWYRYVRRGLMDDVEVSKSDLDALIEVELDDSRPIHVSDAENNVTDVSDTKLIVYDVPWTEEEIDQEEVDWTATESTLFDTAITQPSVLNKEEVSEWTKSKENLDEEYAPQLEDDSKVEIKVNSESEKEELITDFSELIELLDSTVVVEEKIILKKDGSDSVMNDVEVSAFSQWLLDLKPTMAPVELIKSKVNIEKDRIVDVINKNDLQRSEEVNAVVKTVVESAEANVDTDSVGMIKVKPKRNTKSKKSKKASKKKIKSKRAKKNKKLAQKLRKKKRKQEKLKLKKKKQKKEAKLRRAKKAKAKIRRQKKKSQRSIETILKNKASKKNKKKNGDGKKSTAKSRGKTGKKGNFDLRLASEPLANLLWLQGHRKKAIKMFGDLGLKMPEKKAYFAAQIEKLKKKKK